MSKNIITMMTFWKDRLGAKILYTHVKNMLIDLGFTREEADNIYSTDIQYWYCCTPRELLTIDEDKLFEIISDDNRNYDCDKI
jgi:hypothetical protein